MATVSTNIKIDVQTKKEAQELFKELGMSLSTAINIFLKQSIRERGIPFYIENREPNEELLEALAEVEEMKKNPSNYKSYSSADEMVKDVLGE